MRLPRPRFAILLVAVLALLAGALTLAHTGPQRLGPPSAIGSRPARACETAQASAQRTAQATLRANAKAQLPVSVTERAEVRGQLAVGRLSETIVERVELTEPLTVQRTAVIQRRACAAGQTVQAAKGQALTSAYRSALRAAQSAAAAEARRDANALVARMLAAELGSARELATYRARHAAKALQVRLARTAMAAARARAAAATTRTGPGTAATAAAATATAATTTSGP